jgi:hypothetical protein
MGCNIRFDSWHCLSSTQEIAMTFKEVEHRVDNAIKALFDGIEDESVLHCVPSHDCPKDVIKSYAAARGAMRKLLSTVDQNSPTNMTDNS